MAEDKTQTLVLRADELQCRLNSEPHRVYAIKAWALIGAEG